MKHTHTQTTQINFRELEKRLLSINDETKVTCWQFERRFFKYLKSDYLHLPTLIMATGGSKAAAYYLQMVIESLGIITEVIEPRDYSYKQNINFYKRLVAISNSGSSLGINEALENFKGEKYLITGTYKEIKNVESLFWSNEEYINIEKSFISIIPTLAPILMTLDCIEKYKQNQEEKSLKEINTKLKTLLEKSKQRIENMTYNFKDTNLIQIISGYDTKTSSTILESNLTESGTSPVVIHDKGSFCHGRSNLILNNPESPIIFLSHKQTELDKLLLETLLKEYPNIFLMHTLDLEEKYIGKNYTYLFKCTTYLKK